MENLKLLWKSYQTKIKNKIVLLKQMKYDKLLLIFGFIFLFACKTKPDKIEKSFDSLPEPIGAVSDYANLFTKPQIDSLTKIITNFEIKTTNQIAIITVNDIKPYTDFNLFSVDISESFGIGQKDKDNGLSIVIAKNLRKIRISTGYRTEKIVDDWFCKKTIDSVILPEFIKDDYFKGIKNGLNHIITHWK